MELIKVGMLGMSEGNGHPYSWSAIVNGYNKNEMEECGFKSIPRYLEKHDMEQEKLKNAQISHIWTQDQDKTRHIAKTTFIKNTCRHWRDMLEEVDAVILARDDSENHLKHAEEFLKRGIPIYIDKPIATSINEAQKIYNLQKYKGQLFTCSALRYAPDFELDGDNRKKIGKIRKIKGTTIKDWTKYSIHIIEPSLCICNPVGNIISYSKYYDGTKNLLKVSYQDLELQFETTGENVGGIRLEIIGEKGKIVRKLGSPFEAFKNSLMKFIEGINLKKEMIAENEVMRIVEIIELGK